MGPLSSRHCGRSTHCIAWQGGYHNWGEGPSYRNEILCNCCALGNRGSPRYNTNVLVGMA